MTTTRSQQDILRSHVENDTQNVHKLLPTLLQTSLFDGSGDVKECWEALRATTRRIVAFFPSLASSSKPTELVKAADMIRELETLLILILRPLLRGDAELLVEDMRSASDILDTLNDSYGHIEGKEIMEDLNNI